MPKLVNDWRFFRLNIAIQEHVRKQCNKLQFCHCEVHIILAVSSQLNADVMTAFVITDVGEHRSV